MDLLSSWTASKVSFWLSSKTESWQVHCTYSYINKSEQHNKHHLVFRTLLSLPSFSSCLQKYYISIGNLNLKVQVCYKNGFPITFYYNYYYYFLCTLALKVMMIWTYENLWAQFTDAVFFSFFTKQIVSSLEPDTRTQRCLPRRLFIQTNRSFLTVFVHTTHCLTVHNPLPENTSPQINRHFWKYKMGKSRPRLHAPASIDVISVLSSSYML